MTPYDFTANLDPDDPDDAGPARDPLCELWQRPTLAHIRRAAHARGISAEMTLLAVLARVAAATPPTITLPPIVGGPGSLNFFAALAAPTGASKTTSIAVARELLPVHIPFDSIGVASGEGLLELMMTDAQVEGPDGKVETRRVMVDIPAALILVEEGAKLSDLGGRTGNTLDSVLREIWTGAPVGTANATKDRFRHLGAHTYRFALVVAIQPAHADSLLAEPAKGLPQRFVWAGIDDTIPAPGPDRPAWPGRLTWESPASYENGGTITLPSDIEMEVAHRHWLRNTGRADELGLDPADLELESHSDLLRLKIAALLASLEGRHLDLRASDWHLAGVLLRRSNQIRDAAIDAIHYRDAAKNRSRLEQRKANEIELDEHKIQNATEKGAGAIARKVWRTDGPLSRSDAQRACSGPHRELSSVDAMCEYAVGRGWIVETDEGFVRGISDPEDRTG